MEIKQCARFSVPIEFEVTNFAHGFRFTHTRDVYSEKKTTIGQECLEAPDNLKLEDLTGAVNPRSCEIRHLQVF